MRIHGIPPVANSCLPPSAAGFYDVVVIDAVVAVDETTKAAGELFTGHSGASGRFYGDPCNAKKAD